jgi:prepilin-type N-terminal cleavage/methylation domain-containing protein
MSACGDRRATEHGFTLLELLVAITLLGLLMAALFGGLRLGARVWETADADRFLQTVANAPMLNLPIVTGAAHRAAPLDPRLQHPPATPRPHPATADQPARYEQPPGNTKAFQLKIIIWVSLRRI